MTNQMANSIEEAREKLAYMTLSKEDIAGAGEKPEDYRITRENEH